MIEPKTRTLREREEDRIMTQTFMKTEIVAGTETRTSAGSGSRIKMRMMTGKK